MSGYKEEIACASAAIGGREVRWELRRQDGLQVCGMLDEGVRYKECLNRPMDAPPRFMVESRAGGIDLQGRRMTNSVLDVSGKTCAQTTPV